MANWLNILTGNQQCLKEDQECEAALERAEKKTGVKSAKLKMSSGQDVLKARKLLQTLFILVVVFVLK